jgi:hypothetical protein
MTEYQFKCLLPMVKDVIVLWFGPNIPIASEIGQISWEGRSTKSRQKIDIGQFSETVSLFSRCEVVKE